MSKYFCLSLCLIMSVWINSNGQSISEGLNISGYLETYYSNNISNQLKGKKELFGMYYNHNRQGEINLNLAFVKFNQNNASTRFNLGLMMGTYAKANLAAEPTLAQMIYEANAGVKLSKAKNIWLDVGVLPSHIGYENAQGSENLTLTRSIIADNSPYFETGARVSYTSKNEKLYLAALALNGWQNIYATSKKSAFGTQLSYQLNTNIKLNNSTYFGLANSVNRFYNDAYIEYKKKNTKLIASLDNGIDFYNSYNRYWTGTSIMWQQKINQQNSITLREEFIMDNTNVILAIDGNLYLQNPLSTSLNYDYALSAKTKFRLEPKYVITNVMSSSALNSIADYFIFTSSLCVNF
jgi:Putative beta-barrel porin-2, OmpL-like. bbp2